ncbi:type IX secretion system plug protein [Polaribacter gochangensis]|uniref:type IX secretion system plug protein n=1 Tax=Polaribacter gochangensis TaxID=3252903 RepID=UPI003904D02E
MKRSVVTLCITIMFSTISVAQQLTTKNIKSIILKPLESNNFSTIVPLGQTLILSFDDLDADQKEYSYKIEHMNSDWKPSNISTNEYITGFQQNNILDYENSFNTLQDYTNYSVQVPNENTKITKSGNYLISVLDELQNIIFSRKFTYYESKALVGVAVVRSRNTSSKNQQQTVQFTINYNANEIRNPSQELKVVVLQNNIWETAVSNLKPQFFRNNQLVYKYYNKPNFYSGNEYLNFDNKQIRNSTVQIARVEKKDIYHAYLYPQEARNLKSYTYFPDINGQFVIRTTEGNNPFTEADYAMVHFSLDIDEIANKEIYVYGAFNDFKTTSENKMNFNTDTKKYEASILLKQGFYNYTFATKDKKNCINTHEINGSFYQTENEYTVLVFYKAFGENYQRVFGVGSTTVNEQE